MASHPVAGATQSVPTTEIVGPGGRLVVNTSDLDQWRKKGYSPVTEQPNPTQAPVKQPESGAKFDWSSLSVPELHELAEANNLKVPQGARKPEIIDMLIQAEVSPPTRK